MEPAVELRPVLDRAWLDAVAEREPFVHAYTLWDLDRFPQRIRVVSAVQGSTTIGYLLIWLGDPDVPVVHWYGSDPANRSLAERLPARPFVAVVPPEWARTVRSARGEGTEIPGRLLGRDPRPVPGSPGERPAVRPLDRTDGPRLWEWAAQHGGPLTSGYAGLDPAADAVWGAFDGDRLVGAARAAVRRPREWIVTGVFVEPAARGRGLGRRLVGAVVAAAAEAKAAVGLYVRDDRAEARAVYESLGFRTVGRRIWVDVGAGVAP